MFFFNKFSVNFIYFSLDLYIQYIFINQKISGLTINFKWVGSLYVNLFLMILSKK